MAENETIPSPSAQVAATRTSAPLKKKKKSKIIAIVHPEGCTGCEVCIEFCPVDCIYKVPGPEHPDQHSFGNVNGVVVVDEEVCIGCKLCAKYCPWEVIDMIPREEEASVAA